MNNMNNKKNNKKNNIKPPIMGVYYYSLIINLKIENNKSNKNEL